MEHFLVMLHLPNLTVFPTLFSSDSTSVIVVGPSASAVTTRFRLIWLIWFWRYVHKAKKKNQAKSNPRPEWITLLFLRGGEERLYSRHCWGIHSGCSIDSVHQRSSLCRVSQIRKGWFSKSQLRMNEMARHFYLKVLQPRLHLQEKNSTVVRSCKVKEREDIRK